MKPETQRKMASRTAAFRESLAVLSEKVRLARIIHRHSASADFTLRQTGPATYEATFRSAVRLRPGFIASELGAVAGESTIDRHIINIVGAGIHLRLITGVQQ